MGTLRIYIAPETFFPLVGGSEKQAFAQSRYLRAQGFEATIITMHFQYACPAYERIEGVPVIRVAGRILAWHKRLPGIGRRLCYLLALCMLGWQLWRHRQEYDILHVFQVSLFTLPALFVCRLACKPVVVAMRCDVPPEGTRCAGEWNGSGGLVRMDRLVLPLIACQVRRARACVVVLSTHMRESLARYGFDPPSIRLIPNGVDIEAFVPNNGWEQLLTVVCVAKFRYQKGIDVLLHAWHLLIEQLPGARLVLVGDGPLEASLRSLATELGISASVEFAGLCAGVQQHYWRGSVAVLPSRWEGMPNALLEAMACGRACVATRVSGSVDILSQGEYGLLVEPEDSDSLASALWLLLTEPELARRYGQQARQHIERYYAFERIMNQYIALYYELFENSASAGQLGFDVAGMN